MLVEAVAALFVVDAVAVLPALAQIPEETQTIVLPARAVLESQVRHVSSRITESADFVHTGQVDYNGVKVVCCAV